MTRFKPLLIIAALLGATLAINVTGAQQPGALVFEDRFDTGLAAWSIVSPRAEYVRIRESGDEAHGKVLELRPGGDVLALINGSEAWDGVRIDGEVLFPTSGNNYFGVAYNARQTGDRWDFGLIYIKGNGSYLQANPHRDFNVGRTMYPEYRAELEGDDAIEAGAWKRFRVEVLNGMCHFYVGDMRVPKMTFPHFEGRSGQIGFQPRSVGDEVWLDNVKVTRIDALSYRGSEIPASANAPGSLLTSWEVAGPLARTNDALVTSPATDANAWRPYATDARGAVVTGAVADYHGPRTVAYFRTSFTADEAGRRTLHLSAIDDVAVWINGRFHWFVPRGGAAWFDFATNEKHAGRRIPIPVRAGRNDIVLRVRGGVYASGAFYARVE